MIDMTVMAPEPLVLDGQKLEGSEEDEGTCDVRKFLCHTAKHAAGGWGFHWNNTGRIY